MIKKVIFLSFVILFSNTAHATMAKWLIRPGFDKIGYYNEHIFKCQRNGQYELYDNQGRSLLPFPADSITNFTEGYALVLDRTDDATKWNIKGYLSEKGLQFIPIKEGYYTMLYSFFSNGLLAVGNRNNQYGYLDTQGMEVISCHYQKARPFIQGWASVQPSNNKVLFINKAEQPMIIRFHHGEVNDATSFNDEGKAVVIHYKSKDMAIINTRGEVVTSYVMPSHVKKFYRDYDRSFCENCTDFDAPRNVTPQYDPTVSIFTSDGLYGYKFSGSSTIPAQFTHAGQVSNNLAIVAQEGLFGVLAITEGTVTGYIKEEGNLVIDPNKTIPSLTFILELPDDIQPVKVDFDRGNGIMNAVELRENKYVFTPDIDKKAKQCILRVKVYVDDILLFEETFIKGVRQDPLRLSVGTPSSVSSHANHDDIQTVKATVTNHSATQIQVVVTFNASFSANSPNSIVNPQSEAMIPPGESLDFFASVLVKQPENVKIIVTANANNKKQTTSSSTISLVAYD